MADKELLAERFGDLYAPMAALFLERHVTSSVSIKYGDWRQRVRNAAEAARGPRPWRAILLLADRGESKEYAEVEFGGSFPLAEIQALLQRKIGLADRALVDLVAAADRSRYEEPNLDELTDQEYALFRHVVSEYARLSKYAKAPGDGQRTRDSRGKEIPVAWIGAFALIVAALIGVVGPKLMEGRRPEAIVGKSPSASTLVLIGSGSVFQYLRCAVEPHVDTLNASLVDAGSRLGARILAASNLTPGSGIDLLAMSSKRFSYALFDSSQIVPSDYVYEVLIGRFRPWVAIGGPDEAARDRVFADLVADSRHHLRHKTADGIPLVSREVLRRYLWPVDKPGAQRGWFIWRTSSESGTLADFNSYLGGSGAQEAWPAVKSSPYEASGLDDAVKCGEPWIGIGNEYLNARFETPASGGASRTLASWNGYPKVKVFYLMCDTCADSVWTEGLYLYGRLQPTKKGERFVRLPSSVELLLAKLLSSPSPIRGVTDAERDSQRVFLDLQQDPTRRRGGVFVGGSNTVVQNGWEVAHERGGRR